MLTIPPEIQEALQAVEDSVESAHLADTTYTDAADALSNAEAENITAQADQLLAHQAVTTNVEKLVELINAQLAPKPTPTPTPTPLNAGAVPSKR